MSCRQYRACRIKVIHLTKRDCSGWKRQYKSYAKCGRKSLLLLSMASTIKIRRAPTKHDNIDFKSIITRTSEIKPLSVAVADKGYDSEENHILVREDLKAYCVIPPRYAHVPIWRTRGRYRKQMKREYTKLLYNQPNKDETIISVIKRLFGEYVTLRLVRTQNRELSFRCIAYNTDRLTNLTIIIDGFYKAYLLSALLIYIRPV